MITNRCRPICSPINFNNFDANYNNLYRTKHLIQMNTIKDKPTKKFYGLFQYIFDHYNSVLFNDEIKDVVIVITRKKNVFGHFAFKRWFAISDGENETDELALNPAMFMQFPLIEICQTIVHEMVHGWQYHYGEASRAGYHNKEWSVKMQEVGLMPSHNGKVGGKKTGQQMADYPILNSPFMEATEELLTGEIFTGLYLEVNPALSNLLTTEVKPTSFDEIKDFVISQPKPLAKPKSKVKYSCSCSNVWGKRNLSLTCNNCGELYIEN